VESLQFPTMYNFINTTPKLTLHYYWPFKSDLPSQQHTAILLPQYSDNDIIHGLLKIK